MRRQIAAILLLAALLGCSDRPTAPTFHYREATTPENIVLNLQDAYRWRDLEEYAKLLGPEFQFVFDSEDQADLGVEYRTRDEDLARTEGLFLDPVVKDVRLEMTLREPSPATVEFPEGTMKIFATSNHLEIDTDAGVTYKVANPQVFFVRPGDPDLGEMPEHWYLTRWYEVPA